MNNWRMNSEKGFSLLELMITTTIFLIVLLGVYTMVSHFANTSRTENSRLRMQQETRYLTNNFAAELKNAGSVMTLANTNIFLDDTPYFNGIYPLNNNNFPDGIIIAIGDPDATTTLTASHSFSSDGMELQVESTDVIALYDEPIDDTTISMNSAPWRAGDIGIIIGTTGYYVFSVEAVTANSITTRAQPVYYSGLLNTVTGINNSRNFIDPEAVKGNAIQYPGSPLAEASKAPVIRLSSFSIYLFKDIPHPVYSAFGRRLRQFVRVYDTKGIADVLNDANVEMDLISENIWDMQITYTAYTEDDFVVANPTTDVDPNHFYFGQSGSSNSLDNLLADIRSKLLKQFNIDFVTITDEYGIQGKYEHGTITHKVQPIGDEAEYDLSQGRFGFKILTLQIEPRNYNIPF